jgi:hypothetical protein
MGKWLILLAFASFVVAGEKVRVKGYFRKDGTYVEPHYRTAPDKSTLNNWSTEGNVNPYTGEVGTKPAARLDHTIPLGVRAPNLSAIGDAYNAGVEASRRRAAVDVEIRRLESEIKAREAARTQAAEALEAAKKSEMEAEAARREYIGARRQRAAEAGCTGSFCYLYEDSVLDSMLIARLRRENDSLRRELETAPKE